MRDLPDVPVRVREGSRGSSPVRNSGGAHDRGANLLCFIQRCGDFLWSAHVVGQFNARRAVPAEGGPKAEHHRTRLEETDLVVGLLRLRPSEGFIECSGPGEIVHTKGDQTDALLHSISMPKD